MKLLQRYTMITETATETGNDWSNIEIAKFHAFNPNGLVARKRIVDTKISDAVVNGTAISGAIIAFGSLNDFSTNAIFEIATQKRLVGYKLYAACAMLEKDIAAAEQFLETIEIPVAA